MSETPEREPTFYEQMHDITTELFFLSLRIHKAINERDQQIEKLTARIEQLEQGHE